MQALYHYITHWIPALHIRLQKIFNIYFQVKEWIYLYIQFVWERVTEVMKTAKFMEGQFLLINITHFV